MIYSLGDVVKKKIEIGLVPGQKTMVVPGQNNLDKLSPVFW